MSNEVLHDPVRVNEMASELLGVHALNSFTPYNAPARGTMFSGHFTQRPVISGSEPNLILTGNEEEFGKYTFSVKMPEDGTILRVIPKYPPGISEDSINFNPETLIIYRQRETGTVDCFTIPYYLSLHPTFGFQYEQKPALSSLTVGKSFDKDTVFADSPAVKGAHHYTYAKNLNVVYMSHPNVGLDTYVINRDALKHFRFKVYETRTISCGANSFLLNLYGGDEDYQGIPNIGDYIREDGLLAVTRRFVPELAPALLGKRDLQRVDYLTDKPVYVRAGKGRVIDVTVIGSENVNRRLPPMMSKQLEKYAAANQRFHHEIVKMEEQLVRESRAAGHDGRIDVSKKFHALIKRSKGIINDCKGRQRQPLTITHRREPLDAWRITITIEYEITPTRAFKFTCCNGGGPSFT